MHSRVQAIVRQSPKWGQLRAKLVWEGRTDELTPEQLVGAVKVKGVCVPPARAPWCN